MYQLWLATQLFCAIYYWLLLFSDLAGYIFLRIVGESAIFAKIIHKHMVFNSKLIKQKGHTFTRVGIDEDCKEKKNVHLQIFKNKLKIETSFLFPALYP